MSLWRLLDLACDDPVEHGWIGSTYLGAGQRENKMTTDLDRLGGFVPTYGDRFVVLSTGDATRLTDPDQSECRSVQPPRFPNNTCPSWDMETTNWHALPAPITTTPVDERGESSCATLPERIGMGDCSNSLAWPFRGRDCNFPDDDEGLECSLGRGRDLAGYQIHLEAPMGATGLAFDFAFLTAEYPFHYSKFPVTYADMFVAWLDSDKWTGNISLEPGQLAITSDTRLLQYFDAPHSAACQTDCVAPILHNTAMAGHAATPWMTTVAPVAGGETLSLTLIVFDMGHDHVDSVVLIDNLRWLCTPMDEPFTGPRR